MPSFSPPQTRINDFIDMDGSIKRPKEVEACGRQCQQWTSSASTRSGTDIDLQLDESYMGESERSGFTSEGVVAEDATLNREDFDMLLPSQPVHKQDWDLEPVAVASEARLRSRHLWLAQGGPRSAEVASAGSRSATPLLAAALQHQQDTSDTNAPTSDPLPRRSSVQDRSSRFLPWKQRCLRVLELGCTLVEAGVMALM